MVLKYNAMSAKGGIRDVVSNFHLRKSWRMGSSEINCHKINDFGRHSSEFTFVICRILIKRFILFK